MPFNPNPDIGASCPCPCCRDDGIDLTESKYDILCLTVYCIDKDGNATEFETTAFRFGFPLCAWRMGLPELINCIINADMDPDCPFPTPIPGSGTITNPRVFCADSCLPCDELNNWFVAGSASSQCGGTDMEWNGSYVTSGSCDPFLFSFQLPPNFCDIDPEIVPEGCDCECDCCKIIFDLYLGPCP